MGRFCISEISNINNKELMTQVSSDKICCLELVLSSFPLRFWLLAVGYDCYGMCIGIVVNL